MKPTFPFLLLITLSTSTAIPNPFADPITPANLDSSHHLVARKVCTRKLVCGNRKGACVDTSKANACVGGQIYKADCGSEGASWYCCITGVSDGNL